MVSYHGVLWSVTDSSQTSCLWHHTHSHHTYPGICWHYLIEAERNLTIIGSDNGLSPGRCQPLSEPMLKYLGTKFSEISSEIHTFSFKQKRHLKVSSATWWSFCLGLNVWNTICMHTHACTCTNKTLAWKRNYNMEKTIGRNYLSMP